MELKEVLLKRRSIRKFKEDEISEDIINELMVAAMSGPSACNKKPWEFYVITNKDNTRYKHCFLLQLKKDEKLSVLGVFVVLSIDYRSKSLLAKRKPL